MILMSYDGSADAKSAIDRAGRLMPGAEATVLTVWESHGSMLSHTGGLVAVAGTLADAERIDGEVEATARATAAEGAQRASAAGLVALPRTSSLKGSTAQTVLDVAQEIDAELIVLGTRGLGGVRSFLLGSVSHAVVQNADRAVLIVRSQAMSEQTRDQADLATVGGSRLAQEAGGSGSGGLASDDSP